MDEGLSFQKESEVGAHQLVPLMPSIYPYLTEGTNTEVTLCSRDLEQVDIFLRELLSRGKLWVTGKLPFLMALREGGHSYACTLNNLIRMWFIFNNYAGQDWEVSLVEGCRKAYWEEFGNFNSDIDLKTATNLLQMRMLSGYSGGPTTVVIQHDSQVIPSRPWVRNIGLIYCDISDGILWDPFIRFQIAPLPLGADEQRGDRRWGGVNRFQLRTPIILIGDELIVQFNQQDTDNINSGKDAYCPNDADPLAKVLITASRMLLYGAMRWKLGCGVGLNDVRELYEDYSVLAVREYAKQHGGERVDDERVWQEWYMNMTIIGLLEPNMVFMLSEMGLVPFLPPHWQEANWGKVRQQTIESWRFDGHEFSTIDTLAKLVEALTGKEISRNNPWHPNVRANQEAMNWIFSGHF